jgi:A nuclease of the HNH/ENDO VII superfamily with conserved WHH
LSKFTRTYREGANQIYDVELSTNRLVPDFSTKGGKYLHPENKGRVVRIEMTGLRKSDDAAALDAIRKLSGDDSFKKPEDYTWHHMDDFEYINGKAYCTMQLVETSAHSASGMTHSGSVAQYKVFGLVGYP